MVSTLYKGDHRTYKSCTSPESSLSQTPVFSLEFVGVHCFQITVSSDHYHDLLELGGTLPVLCTSYLHYLNFLHLQRYLRDLVSVAASFLFSVSFISKKKQKKYN